MAFIKAVLIAALCLGGNAMHLMKTQDMGKSEDKEEIKPVPAGATHALNLVEAQHQQSEAAHNALHKMQQGSKNTAVQKLFDAAEQGLNMVEYESKKEAKIMSDTVKSIENEEKKVQDAIDYQVGKVVKPIQAKVKQTERDFKEMEHTVKVLSHRQVVQEHMEKLKTYTYKDFVKDHKRQWKEGSSEWKKHEEAFDKKYAAITAHNSALPDNSWATGVNKFMDYTDDELNMMFGYKGMKEPQSSLLQMDDEEEEDLPIEFSWSPRLKKSSFHRDQGACGSCWAVAAAQVVEDHLQLTYNETYQLSIQHLVSCTPNPQQCGGTGGCKGATSELAFKYIQEHGVAAHAHWPYTSGQFGKNGECKANFALSHRFAKIGGYVVLPENKQAPLLKALYQQGPLVVSVAATNWAMYSFGVFAGCSKDAVINHAVVAEGFGKQKSDLDGKEHKYFLLKNSWGDDWGEEGGYIKIKRFDSEKEHCGLDKKPADGTGCLNGPATVPVCGMCGVLYDAAYPMNPEFVGKDRGGVYVKGEKPKSLHKVRTLFNSQAMPLR